MPHASQRTTTAGRHQQPACAALGGVPLANTAFDYFYAGGIEHLVSAQDLYKPKKPFVPGGPLLAEGVIEPGLIVAFPPEPAAPPLDWLLPPRLNGDLGALDLSAGLRFARFAADSSVRFNGGGDDRLRGISDIVAATTIEAVTDAFGRALRALAAHAGTRRLAARDAHADDPARRSEVSWSCADWSRLSDELRAPNPAGVGRERAAKSRWNFRVSRRDLRRAGDGLSARRVHAHASLRSRQGGSSAAATLDTRRRRVRARHAALPAALGKPWPKFSDFVSIPDHLLEVAVKHLNFTPELLVAAYQNNWSAEELERRIEESLKPPIVNPAFRAASEVPDAFGAEEDKS